ncbi:MAG: hypothetical protein H0Z19_10910, partial [Archaeoglobus sp.]|nr:hypothetical protein [Archaeoglobus sp.]
MHYNFIPTGRGRGREIVNLDLSPEEREELLRMLYNANSETSNLSLLSTAPQFARVALQCDAEFIPTHFYNVNAGERLRQLAEFIGGVEQEDFICLCAQTAISSHSGPPHIQVFLMQYAIQAVSHSVAELTPDNMLILRESEDYFHDYFYRSVLERLPHGSQGLEDEEQKKCSDKDSENAEDRKKCTPKQGSLSKTPFINVITNRKCEN